MFERAELWDGAANPRRTGSIFYVYNQPDECARSIELPRSTHKVRCPVDGTSGNDVDDTCPGRRPNNEVQFEHSQGCGKLASRYRER